jgi:sulfide:quinone oxidoreductase
MFELGTMDGATMLQLALKTFERGRLVIDSVEQPVRRPLNLLRFAMLAQSYFLQRGTRDRVDIAFAAPLAGAFETRHASLAFTRMLAERGVAVEPDFRTAVVHGERGALRSAAGREVSFDLLVTLPVRAGAAFVERSRSLGDGRGFVRCDAQTRHALGAPNVFAVGAARGGTTGAAEMSASVEARLVAENVWRRATGRPLIRGLEELTPAPDAIERPVTLGGVVAEPMARSGGDAPAAVVVERMATELRAGPHPHTWTLNVPVGHGGASVPGARPGRQID